MASSHVVFAFLVIFIATAVLANEFVKLNVNHLLQKLDPNTIDLSQVDEKWIDQPLDHFNSNEKRTLKMRYFERLDLWQPGGPIIIFVGGEGTLLPVWIASNPVISTLIAKESNGALLATEHRYYGKSLPAISRNNLTEFYQFQSSQQALADIAYLIKTFKSDSKYESSKVVVVGGSYAGNLAVWLRELYPGLVDAAVAASAPVLAKKDFKEYLEVVSSTFGTYGDEGCLNRITEKFQGYDKLLKSSQGIDTLKKQFNICPDSDLTVLENQQLLFLYLFNDLKIRAQYGQPKEVLMKCKSINEQLYSWSIPVKSKLFGRNCNNIDFNSLDLTDPWSYQYCSEFGYLQTTTAEIQPFVHWNPLQFTLKLCKDLVKGDIERRIDEGVAKSNLMYGGKHPNVTKVVFTHGDMDPWHPLGVLEDLGPDAPAIMNNGTSHCAIFVGYRGEPKEITKNRIYIVKLIKKWISS